ncbi:MAG TPA: hypothetical protein VKB84_04905 [Candidatus Binataceae bacterium]|nr:hypothetical protein [Candidatus Binataceae bacterium]
MRRNLLVCWPCALILTAFINCLGLTAAGAQQTAAPAGFTGLWAGTIHVVPCLALRDSHRCGAVNKVTFTIIDDGSKVSGHYTCAIGNQICRNGNADNTGKIVSGRASSNSIRFTVIVPADVSSCNYTGTSPSPGQMRGGYTCYEGGGLIEQGNFEVTREGG